MTINEFFSAFARGCARIAGHPLSTVLAFLIVICWAALGKHYNYSDTWQLIINTFTTVVTFLIVFLIQNSQNRDSLAIQIKLDELIRSQPGAHNALLDLENLSQGELIELKKKFEEGAINARILLEKGKIDTHTKEL